MLTAGHFAELKQKKNDLPIQRKIFGRMLARLEALICLPQLIRHFT